MSPSQLVKVHGDATFLNHHIDRVKNTLDVFYDAIWGGGILPRSFNCTPAIRRGCKTKSVRVVSGEGARVASLQAVDLASMEG